MDENQNNPTPPASDQPTEAPVSNPVAAEEKCVTCGSSASGGNCMACGQGVVTCSCAPSTGGSGPAMGGETPQGAPAM